MGNNINKQKILSKKVSGIVGSSAIPFTWVPTDESSLFAWYKFKTGLTVGLGSVSQWDDSSVNDNIMSQDVAGERPVYDDADGSLRFVTTSDTNLQYADDVEFAGQFTVGIKMYPSTFNGVLVGSVDTSGEFIKINTSTQLTIKIDSTAIQLDLDVGTPQFGDGNIVVTRNSGNVISLYKNGELQADTGTLEGTIQFNCIGLRQGGGSGVNGYQGDIFEIQIYDSSGGALSENISTYLADI